jgi:Haspin like kinase domain
MSLRHWSLVAWVQTHTVHAAPPLRARMLCCRGVDTKAKTGGLAVTLIDFTLSRVTMPGGAVAFCDLSADPELFAGPKGDCQVRRFPS